MINGTRFQDRYAFPVYSVFCIISHTFIFSEISRPLFAFPGCENENSLQMPILSNVLLHIET